MLNRLLGDFEGKLTSSKWPRSCFPPCSEAPPNGGLMAQHHQNQQVKGLRWAGWKTRAVELAPKRATAAYCRGQRSSYRTQAGQGQIRWLGQRPVVSAVLGDTRLAFGNLKIVLRPPESALDLPRPRDINAAF